MKVAENLNFIRSRQIIDHIRDSDWEKGVDDLTRWE